MVHKMTRVNKTYHVEDIEYRIKKLEKILEDNVDSVFLQNKIEKELEELRDMLATPIKLKKKNICGEYNDDS